MAGGIPKIVCKDPNNSEEVIEISFYPDQSKKDKLLSLILELNGVFSRNYYSEWTELHRKHYDKDKIHNGIYYKAGTDYIEECDLNAVSNIEGSSMILNEKYFGPLIIMKMASMVYGDDIDELPLLQLIKTFIKNTEWFGTCTSPFILGKRDSRESASSNEIAYYFDRFLDCVQIDISNSLSDANHWREEMHDNYSYVKEHGILE